MQRDSITTVYLLVTVCTGMSCDVCRKVFVTFYVSTVCMASPGNWLSCTVCVMSCDVM